MREICTLRAMWRGLETEPRVSLHGHEGGNPGNSQGKPYGPPRQSSTLPTDGSRRSASTSPGPGTENVWQSSGAAFEKTWC